MSTCHRFTALISPPGRDLNLPEVWIVSFCGGLGTSCHVLRGWLPSQHHTLLTIPSNITRPDDTGSTSRWGRLLSGRSPTNRLSPITPSLSSTITFPPLIPNFPFLLPFSLSLHSTRPHLLRALPFPLSPPTPSLYLLPARPFVVCPIGLLVRFEPPTCKTVDQGVYHLWMKML